MDAENRVCGFASLIGQMHTAMEQSRAAEKGQRRRNSKCGYGAEKCLGWQHNARASRKSSP